MNKVLLCIFVFFLNTYCQTNDQHDNLPNKSKFNLHFKISKDGGNNFQLNYNKNSSHYFINSARLRPYIKENKKQSNIGFELLFEREFSDHHSLIFGLAYSSINLKPRMEYGFIPGYSFDDRDNFHYNIDINNIRIPLLIKFKGKASSNFTLFLTGGMGINIINNISSYYEHEVLSRGYRKWYKKEKDVIEIKGIPLFITSSTGLKYKSVFVELSYTYNFSEIAETFGSINKEMGDRAGYDTKKIFTISYNYFLLNIGFVFSPQS